MLQPGMAAASAARGRRDVGGARAAAAHATPARPTLQLQIFCEGKKNNP